MTLRQIVRSVPARPGRTRLTLEEVLECRRPAVFQDFGDWLLYLDGQVYILRDVDPRDDPEATPPVLDSRYLAHPAGIETGWRHSHGCDCAFCSAKAA